MSARANTRSGRVDPTAGECGTIRKQAPVRIALGYPAPYSVAASSLGFQTVYRTWNQIPGVACSRFFPPDKGPIARPLTTVEDRLPVAEASAIGLSIACETELGEVARLLAAAGLAPLAEDRDPAEPPVIIGGPLTGVDPRLVAPFADAVAVGEAELALPSIAEALSRTARKPELLETLSAQQHGVWVPTEQANPPPPARAPIESLPAAASTWSPQAELKNLFLVESSRGCPHGCTFCVLSARTQCAGRFRAVPPERVIAAIPKDAPGVGLVGAAVTDHPQIESLVAEIVAAGRRVSLSSIRADRLTAELADHLRAGGLRTLTLAADGASEALRKTLQKQITAADLGRAAEIAATAGIRGLKLYAMVGLPDETDADVEELARLVADLDKRPRVAIAAQAFVPKPGTPLGQVTMAEVGLIRHRLDLLGRSLKGRARVIPTSPRWSWVDWKLAHAGERAALVAIEAERNGGKFAAWKRAIQELGL
ncbi:MAG: B12-binding domain-containing radical SAM protein [Deltaproteobacteria bacterium]|nr:B12-binding domain-containing radical SAM protein [Deltaproteobacteria bacterium]